MKRQTNTAAAPKAAAAVNNDACFVTSESALAAEPVQAAVAYKGFNRDLSCAPNGVKFQYEVGKTYDNGGKPVRRCGAGAFHSVLMPLDAWNYYGPVTSVFAIVTPSGETADDKGSDSKIASAKISIDAEIKLPDFIRRAVRWIVYAAKERVTTGYCAHAASTGYYAHAASTGDYAHAASTGYRAHAASTGYCAHAASTGDCAHAASTGDYAHVASTGDCAHAASTGYRAHAASTGYCAHAASTGDYAYAASTGDCAIAASLGAGGVAKAGEGGAISLAAYDTSVLPHKLVAVRSSMVGENGIEAGKAYRLTLDAQFEVVEG